MLLFVPKKVKADQKSKSRPKKQKPAKKAKAGQKKQKPIKISKSRPIEAKVTEAHNNDDFVVASSAGDDVMLET